MGRLAINDKIEIIYEFCSIEDRVSEDYLDSDIWTECSVLSPVICRNLEHNDVHNLNYGLSKFIFQKMNALQMERRAAYEVYCKSADFGSIIDIVDVTRGNMKGIERYYVTTFDVLTSKLLEQYPDDIVNMSKAIKEGNFEVIDESVFKVGKYIAK